LGPNLSQMESSDESSNCSCPCHAALTQYEGSPCGPSPSQLDSPEGTYDVPVPASISPIGGLIIDPSLSQLEPPDRTSIVPVPASTDPRDKGLTVCPKGCGNICYLLLQDNLSAISVTSFKCYMFQNMLLTYPLFLAYHVKAKFLGFNLQSQTIGPRT
jgi:hypothetical protein